MKRNVLMLITGAFKLGGGIAAVNRLAMKAISEWEEEDCRVTVIALHEPVGSDADVFYLKSDRGIWKPCGGNVLKFTVEVWRSVLSKKYDLILADMAGISSALTPLSVLGFCSYLTWCFGLEISEKFLSQRQHWALAHANKVLAISPTTHQAVTQCFPQANVVTCELAIDPKVTIQNIVLPKNEPVKLKTVSGHEKVIGPKAILCVGRLWSNQRHKGQDALIKAMPIVLKSIPGAQLVLAGSGDLHEEYSMLAKDCGVADAVFITGFVSDEMLTCLYRACYLFAMPSKGEGFGLVYLEAMNWSKPCIGGKLDAARDVIVDQETGVLLGEPHNPDQIAKAVIFLSLNPKIAENMGRAGHKRLEERYLFPHFCERFYHALGWI